MPAENPFSTFLRTHQCGILTLFELCFNADTEFMRDLFYICYASFQSVLYISYHFQMTNYVRSQRWVPCSGAWNHGRGALCHSHLDLSRPFFLTPIFHILQRRPCSFCWSILTSHLKLAPQYHLRHLSRCDLVFFFTNLCFFLCCFPLDWNETLIWVPSLSKFSLTEYQLPFNSGSAEIAWEQM
jgi:hypothetical protein